MRRIGAVSGLALLVISAWTGMGHAESDTVKVGVLTDQSSAYSMGGLGQGIPTAVRMAVEDFGGKVLGKPIVVLSADHQNKTDIGAEIARRWIDQDHIDGFVEVQNTSIVRAVINLAAKANRIAMSTTAGSSDLTNQYCSPIFVHWLWDTYSLPKVAATSLVKEGKKKWFIIDQDYSFAIAMERDTKKFVEDAGGSYLGSYRAPLNNRDFSTALLTAQGSGAQVVATSDAGADAVNLMKQATAFGISRHFQMVGLSTTIVDVDGIGLPSAQGMILAGPFYWDLTDATRAWSKRYYERAHSIPNMFVAGAYTGTLHFLKAVQAAGTVDGNRVMAAMQKLPINDFFTKNGSVRADGRATRPIYLFQVKSPAESKYKWDYYKVVKEIPGGQAFRPLSGSQCPLVAHKS